MDKTQAQEKPNNFNNDVPLRKWLSRFKNKFITKFIISINIARQFTYTSYPTKLKIHISSDDPSGDTKMTY